jgi:predicted transcriptional regulator
MISLHDSEDHTVRRCMDLIERHAPRLMIAGAGPLVQERPNNGRRLTWHKKLRIVTYARHGRLTQAEIARAVGCTEPTVARVVREAE